MSTKSREYLFGTTIRIAAERAREAGKVADRLACEADAGLQGSGATLARPSGTPSTGDIYLEVRSWGVIRARPSRSNHPPAEDDSHSRIGALYAVQGLLAGAALSNPARVMLKRRSMRRMKRSGKPWTASKLLQPELGWS
jgi:hypothetical protein